MKSKCQGLWCFICGADLINASPDICHDCKKTSQHICELAGHPVYWNGEHRTLACPSLWVSACPEGDNKLTPYFGRLYNEVGEKERMAIDRALEKEGLVLRCAAWDAGECPANTHCADCMHNEEYVVLNLKK